MPLRLVVVGLMLASALALGLMAYRLTAPARPAAHLPPAAPATIAMLVTARPLPAGTLARDEDFAARPIPPAALPAGATIDTPQARAAIRGALIRHYLEAAAPITEADVLRPRDRGFLAAVLAPGTRAVSIGVDAVSGVAGLIWPGDRVDVILTQELDHDLAPLAQRVLGETVLRDARVIAVDQEIVQGAPPTAAAAGRPARTVTLQVAAKDAERLAVALHLGRLSLAIRAAGAAPAILGQAPGTGPGTVFGADVSPSLAHATRPVGARVQVIEGDQSHEVTFR